MTVFELALTSIFADQNLVKVTTYVSKSGERKEVRVVVRAPDLHVRFDEASLYSSSTTLEVKVSDLPNLEPGDQFIIDGHIFSVQAPAKRDSEHLVWQVDLHEVNSSD